MSGLPRRSRSDDEEGQALVEMAIVLPILMLILLGIIQFGFVFSGQIALSSAAREGVRLAATGSADIVVQDHVENILAASPLLSDLQVNVSPAAGARTFGGQVTVRIRARSPLIVPLPLVLPGGAFNLAAEAVMRVENIAGGTTDAYQLAEGLQTGIRA